MRRVPETTGRVQLAIEAVDCPEAFGGCGAEKGQPCTYFKVEEWKRHWASVTAQLAREGKPFPGAHQARMWRFGHWEERQNRPAPRPHAPMKTRHRIALIEREYDRRETADLVQWLRIGGALTLIDKRRDLPLSTRSVSDWKADEELWA